MNKQFPGFPSPSVCPPDISFIVNGNRVVLSVEPKRTLMDALRNDLRLTGTKQGCDDGKCGTCAVLMNGKVTMSCRLPLEKAAGKDILTIEGLGNTEKLDPIQTAFVETGAVQCGFCTPGMIISTKALLHQNQNPTRDQIVRRLSKHICRCTGYIKIVEAVNLAAKLVQGLPASGCKPSQVVGSSQRQVDAWDKVRGTAKFGADLMMENQLYARAIRSHHHHARVCKIDVSAGLSVPGVVDILTADDVPGVNRMGYVTRDQPVLIQDKVRRVGDAIAVVAARSEAAAGEALGKIRVEYEPLDAIFDPVRALDPGVPKVHEEGNLMCYRFIESGAVKQGFQNADVIVEGTYSTALAEHAYLEPEAALAYMDDEGRVVIHSSTQNPACVQHEVAHVLGLERDQVRVIPTAIGGGFGGKLDPTTEVLVALAAYKLRQPVKMVFSRAESFVVSTKKHPFTIHLRLGATRDGKFTTLQAKLVGDAGAYASASTRVLTRAVIYSAGPYEIPNVFLEGSVAYTNNPVTGAMRGYGANQACFSIESLVDVLADELHIDPLRLRAMNVVARGSRTVTGHSVEQSVGIRQTIEAIRPYYEEAQRWRAEGSGKPGVARGIGVACACEGLAHFLTGPGKDIVAAEQLLEPGFSGYNPAEAEVELLRDGRICVYTGSVDLGQGSKTVLAQIVAEEMEVVVEDVVVISGDTALTLPAGATSGSRTIFRSGYAVRSAAQHLKSIILDEAAAILGHPASELEVREGFVHHKSKPADRISFLRVVESNAKALRGRGTQASSSDPLFGLSGHTSSTQLAQVEVDTRTGDVRVVRLVSAQDVGKAINPVGVETQIEGGLVMGLGLALTEEFIPGKTFGFREYRVPRLRDVPEITPIIVEVPDEYGPFGAKGIGEQTLIPTPPAITNAIANATGVRIFRIPFNPSVLVGAKSVS